MLESREPASGFAGRATNKASSSSGSRPGRRPTSIDESLWVDHARAVAATPTRTGTCSELVPEQEQLGRVSIRGPLCSTATDRRARASSWAQRKDARSRALRPKQHPQRDTQLPQRTRLPDAFWSSIVHVQRSVPLPPPTPSPRGPARHRRRLQTAAGASKQPSTATPPERPAAHPTPTPVPWHGRAARKSGRRRPP
ncbi:hypothetical protein PVAP13_3KG314008 [Panicum virgatum]|uniref:Uncharacterized protein n=1 Tax=Panicum virgatum TaxID=38727 RepID=A0A8T0V049_PANVG|nr:hypothetical protein PVAP13_3KG314008 [Panicum virgatum]